MSEITNVRSKVLFLLGTNNTVNNVKCGSYKSDRVIISENDYCYILNFSLNSFNFQKIQDISGIHITISLMHFAVPLECVN